VKPSSEDSAGSGGNKLNTPDGSESLGRHWSGQLWARSVSEKLTVVALNYSGPPEFVQAVINRLKEVGYIMRGIGGVFEEGGQAEDFGTLYCCEGTVGVIAPFSEIPAEDAAVELFRLFGCCV
jgi:hypothetical protein